MSRLPKTKYPIFDTKIPSNGTKVNYRQMLVSDEKILLMAKTTDDESDIYRAVKQVVNNCILDDIDIDHLTTFDIEYLFIKIRAVSSGSVIELAFVETDENGENEEHKISVDLDDVQVLINEDIDKFIKITEESGVSLRYPPSFLFDNREDLIGSDGYYYLASQCIDKIFDGEEVYDAKDYSSDELIQYINDLDTKSYDKIKEFIANIPRLNYEITYKTSKGEERKLSLKTLTDFFTFW